MDHLVAIDTLDDLAHNARTVPLTDQVRMRPESLRAAVDDVVATLPDDLRRRAEAEGLLERLEALLREAKPVPLTHDVRFDKDALYEILDGIRALIAPPRTH
jgi:hypothetical protein